MFSCFHSFWWSLHLHYPHPPNQRQAEARPIKRMKVSLPKGVNSRRRSLISPCNVPSRWSLGILWQHSQHSSVWFCSSKVKLIIPGQKKTVPPISLIGYELMMGQGRAKICSYFRRTKVYASCWGWYQTIRNSLVSRGSNLVGHYTRPVRDGQILPCFKCRKEQVSQETVHSLNQFLKKKLKVQHVRMFNWRKQPGTQIRCKFDASE